MGWFSKLFGSASTGVAKGVTTAVENVSTVAERWKGNDATRFEQGQAVEEQTQKFINEARSYDPRSTGGGVVGEFINVIVDAISRAIRPGVTILLLGACFGWWALPQPDTIPEVYFMWTQAVITFWFGARTVFKDIPSFVAAMRTAGRK